jgi:riboflavin biosynthesis pyrimidine reductase
MASVPAVLLGRLNRRFDMGLSQMSTSSPIWCEPSPVNGNYIFAGDRELDLRLGLEILNRELGIKRILLEGGGVTNGAFLRAGLVDEVSLAICPAIDGA